MSDRKHLDVEERKEVEREEEREEVEEEWEDVDDITPGSLAVSWLRRIRLWASGNPETCPQSENSQAQSVDVPVHDDDNDDDDDDDDDNDDDDTRCDLPKSKD